MRALLSVHDKTGIVEFARGLVDLGFEIVSTGGTERELRAGGVAVTAVADVTGFPEILDGRVKTLHPRVHGGLLARRELESHRVALAEHGIVPIDLLACNLYPFERTVASPGVSEKDAIEQIDIGGPAMIRAAAKNFAHVVVVTNWHDYDLILSGLRAGEIPTAERRRLAGQAFSHVSVYDSIVAAFLRPPGVFPDEISFAGRKSSDLRYGENPQQRAAAYLRLEPGGAASGVLLAAQLGGKELSFNNLLDADAAWNAIGRFSKPAVAVVKHNLPCGLAQRNTLADAYALAFAGDPVSAFGGIVALNREVDEETAAAIAETFYEVVIAPGFTAAARTALDRKRQLRLLAMPARAGETTSSWQVRGIRGGWLVQDSDDLPDDAATWQCVTRRQPSAAEREDLAFAWEAARHVKSNAIVLARDDAVVGVGAGQPNRLESVRIAVNKAGSRSAGAVLASDAFFPFADGIEAAGAAGVCAIVQPGGSVRDAEVIAAADSAGIAMLFTGRRHFLH